MTCKIPKSQILNPKSLEEKMKKKEKKRRERKNGKKENRKKKKQTSIPHFDIRACSPPADFSAIPPQAMRSTQ